LCAPGNLEPPTFPFPSSLFPGVSPWLGFNFRGHPDDPPAPSEFVTVYTPSRTADQRGAS
jgi:hypothetical protein